MKRSKPIWIELAAFQVKALSRLNRRINDADKRGKQGCLIAQVYLNGNDEMAVRFLDQEATKAMQKVFETIRLEK
jgi:hypothetical protein